jgi:hypothetical protein
LHGKQGLSRKITPRSAGRAAADLTPADALVVANTPMSFYYAGRQGWKVHYSSPENIRECIEKGARYLITTKTWPLRNDRDFLRYLTGDFHLVKQTREYLLFDLARRGSPAALSRVMKSWSLSRGGLVEAQMPVKTETPAFQLKIVNPRGQKPKPWLLECLLDGRKAAGFHCAPGETQVFTWETGTSIGMHRMGIRIQDMDDENPALPSILWLKMIKKQ